MNEHIANRQRRRELLLMMSYSFFTVLMTLVTTVEDWPLFYIPLLFGELALVWFFYVKRYRSYLFRATIVTLAVCVNIFLYGIQAENFQALIPTLCTQFVLLSLYEISRIMDITIQETILLFLYHALVKRSFVLPDETLLRNRMMLQLFSLVVLIILCVYRIHHHQQEEQDVVELTKQVRREQKLKDDFVANTSHELRTPVNTISGMCEILLQKSLPEDVHRGVLDIQMTSTELQNIITDILDHASLEADTLELATREYNITSTLNDVMNMTVFENRDKQLEIIFDCDPNIPRLMEGDERQLRRVLNNLISNAIKFTHEGGVTVRVTHRKEDYGVNLIISVKDTGVGLSLEEREQILRGFYQSDGSRSRRSSGLGLGLTITSALIKKMGGFLTIKSEPGLGSEFSFAIPQKVVNAEPCISLLHPGSIKLLWFYNSRSNVPSMRDSFVEHIQHFSDYFGIFSQRAASLEECKRRIALGQGAHVILGQTEYQMDPAYFDELSEKIPVIVIAEHDEAPATAPRIHVLYKPYNAMMLAEILNGREHTLATRKKEQKKFVAPTAKILVVDDNLMNLKVVEGLLRKYRIKIATASSGEEALSLIETKDYDFVFMDHTMPGMDGVECFHHIREKQGAYFTQVPIIALTANAIAGSREMFLSQGFNDFIAKPIDTALLHEVLRRFIPLEKQVEEDEPAELAEEIPSRATQAALRRPAPVAAPDDPFDALVGIDKEMALLYCGTLEDFKELAGVYCASGDQYADGLQTAYLAMDMKNYALISHTIKSTSKTLGAVHLSELALAQEMAAKEERPEAIRQNHDEFLAEYRRMLAMLTAFVAEVPVPRAAAPESAPVSSGSVGNWPALKAELRRCLEAYETKAFEEALQGARGLMLNGLPVEMALSGVSKKVSNFDFDGALAELDQIGGAV